ncbi:MAG: penicillin-binding transpeptidase domain-containing protein [Bacillota bacterium]|nr:penicillin-binding transpeptidase domain-containing protein [Bacillota bacterium]
MFSFLTNKKFHLLLMILGMFFFLLWCLYDTTIVHGQEYYRLSLQNRIRKIETTSGRGEITDVKGKPLAVNEIGYAVELNSSLIPADQFNDYCIRLYDFLNKQGEKQQEFPIHPVGGEFKYRFDTEIEDWLERAGYDRNWSARQVFEYERNSYLIDPGLSDYEAMKLLNSKSVYLPISTIDLRFTQEIEKENFLKSYELDPGVSAAEAFQAIREIRSYRIPAGLSDEDAYKVMIYRHLIRDKGYLRYEPIVVAPDVSRETSVLVAERGYEFPGLYPTFTTKRIYPQHDLTAHIVGYLGRIATEGEVAYYVDQLGYNPNQMIGKSGIESVEEERLHGTSGYKYIEADVSGRYIGEVDPETYGLETVKATRGKDLKLTIDTEFQAKMKDVLARAVESMRKGELVRSPFGDYKHDALANVESIAAVMVDVKTGAVLGSYSYPSYDPMLFMNGLTDEDWKQLNPSNPRNPIAARPLIDMTTMMAVQPGSTYKMITGYAGLLRGLDPYQKLYDDGFIEIGGKTFGCWLWNQHRGKHGPIDLMRALQESCNYYFYCIGNGKDYYRDVPLNFTMDSMGLISTSKLFGLDAPSGVEVPETVLGVPQVDRKKETSEVLLRERLESVLPQFIAPERIDTHAKLQTLIDVIVSWADENPERNEIIDRLMELGSSEEYEVTAKLAELIKYDYFNLMSWYEGDTMNLAIGQGEHAYTPMQMARYVAMIANGGYPIELTYVDSVDGVPNAKNASVTESFDPDDQLRFVRQGMRDVVTNPNSYIDNLFKKFPIEVAGKTGTAEKEGRIPPENEAENINTNLAQLAPEVRLEDLELETTAVLKERAEEMTALEKQVEELRRSGKDPEKLEEILHRFGQALSLERLNRGDAMREALKRLSSKTLSDEEINRFRATYDSFAWFVGFAPYENPEVAFAVMIPQGNSGLYAAAVSRELLTAYYGLQPETTPEKEEGKP